MGGVLHEDWKILKEAGFDSTVVVAVYSNVEDGKSVEQTEHGVEENFSNIREDVE